MMTLPARQPKEAGRFIPAAYQSIDIPSGAFDGGGRALSTLGNSLTSVAGDLDKIAQVQERDATSTALMQLEKGALELHQKTSAPTTTGGENTSQGVTPAASFQEQFDALEQNIMASLPNGRSQRDFQMHASPIRQRFMTIQAEAAAGASRQQGIAIKKEAQDVARQMALTFQGDPQAFAEQIRVGRAEAFNQGVREGVTDIPTLEERANRWEASVHGDVIRERVKNGDLETARHLLSEKGSLFDHRISDELTGLLQGADDEKQARTVIAPVLADLNGWRTRLESPADTSAAPTPETPPPSHPGTPFGLSSRDDYLAQFDRAAEKAGLTPQQRMIGRREVQKVYAQALIEARELRQNDLKQAYEFIESGGTPEQLNPLLRRRLGSTGLAATGHLFDRTHGITGDETETGPLLDLTRTGQQDFQNALLPEVRPYVSKGLYTVLESTQKMMNSPDLKQRVQGQSLWSALSLATTAMDKAKISDGAAAEALVLAAITPVHDFFHSGKPYTRQDVSTALVRRITTLRSGNPSL